VFTAGKDLNSAKIAGDLTETNAKVIASVEETSTYKFISEKDLFDVEYWSLEQAKIKKQKKLLEGNVVVITGSTGTIGFETYKLFKSYGAEVVLLDYNLERLKQQALTAAFKPVEMKGLNFKARLNNTIRFTNSHNVAAVKKGSLRPNEYILMMAHWDHLGTKEEQAGDNIYNGAVDNATGVAGILELAETLNDYNNERSLLYLAVTAEESGLLGSAYFAEYPPIDLSQVVAGFNFDAMQPRGKLKDVVVVGYGASQLEDILEKKLQKYDKYLVPDPEPEKGYFYRSDHISLSKKGVPMLYADGGIDKVEGGIEAGEQLALNYVTKDYHQPSDEYTTDWDLSGIAEQLSITAEMILDLANSEDWPEWYEGNEFRSIREASRMAPTN